MNKAACCFHFVFWCCAFGIWLVSTTASHPNWTLRVASTVILIGMSAAYAILWSPRELTAARLIGSLFALLACGFGTALSISLIYDVLLGPDPRRFSFRTNLWMDTAVLLVNTCVAAIAAWAVTRVTGISAWSIKAEQKF